jgi:hypothetical protein
MKKLILAAFLSFTAIPYAFSATIILDESCLNPGTMQEPTVAHWAGNVEIDGTIERGYDEDDSLVIIPPKAQGNFSSGELADKIRGNNENEFQIRLDVSCEKGSNIVKSWKMYRI